MSSRDARLQGIHNEETSGAVLAAAVMEATPPAMQEVRAPRRLPHRVEWVRQWRGIEFTMIPRD